ncbi:gluconolaconase [Pontibacter rugosus]|uniref:Gluconolaconase n=1 Tax=Pontibacter rugosus TaxID=1745966 RepID=A0ABW3SKM7_9BACT
MKHLSVTTAAFLRKQISYLLLSFLCLGTVSCSPDEAWDGFNDLLDEVNKAKDVPEVITFNRQGLYPEGVSHDALYERFFVSSASTGTVGTVDYKGNYMPFITDERLISSIGLEVDENRKRVLIASSDPGNTPNSTPATAGQTAALGIYHLATGAPIHYVNLGALRPGIPHFANDIAIDKHGNAYVTDSFSPIIYKVDVHGNATVFYENEAFATPQGAFGFNGIAYHPAGFLLVAYSINNEIYKIPLSNPGAISKVALDAPLEGPDGLLLSKNGEQLVVVNNAGGQPSGRVLSFRSANKWQTASLAERFDTGPVFPTTATSYGDQVFVLYAHLNKLFGGAPQQQEEFTIRKVPFSKNELFGR